MKAVLKYAIVVAAGLLLAGCGYKVNYSLSGASIPPDAKTFSVAYFPNNAPMVAPILSSTLTDALRDKFTRQTRLTQVDEGGDFVILTSLNSSLVPYDFSMFCKLITFIFRSYFVILLFIILHITIDSNRRPQ